MKSKYNKYLNSKHWRELREDAFRFYGRHCFYCPEKTSGLEVHHIKYKKDLTDCMVKDVVPLCKCCHYEAHQNVHRLDKIKRDVLKFYKNNTKKNGKKKKRAEKNPEGKKYLEDRSKRFQATGNKKKKKPPKKRGLIKEWKKE